MRVAVVHSFYSSRSPSGENQTVVEQARVLAEAGHEVLLVSRSTDQQEARPLYRTRAALRVATGLGDNPLDALRSYRPDIVHVHNLFPNYGTRWLSHWPGPLVATVHNYRPACANGLLLRDGATCLLCPDGDRLAGLRHSCYRGSRLATLPLTIANHDGAARNPLVRRADRLIVLAPRARDLYLRFGVPADRLVLVPNFVTPAVDSPGAAPTVRFAAVGRLSPEKGFADLLAAWPTGLPLDIAGTGPHEDALRSLAGPSVRFLGHVPNDQWRERLPSYTALVLPSASSEAAVPLAVVEAWAAEIPVVARRGNGGADAVEETGAGTTYDDAAGLAAALSAVQVQPATWRALAADAYRSGYTPEHWLATMTGLYRDCLEGSAPPRR